MLHELILPGVAYGDIIVAVGIIVIALIIAKIFIFLLGKFVLHIASKTKTKLDDIIFRTIKRPIYVGILLGGIYLALVNLTYMAPYTTQITQAFSIIAVLWAVYIVIRFINAFLHWYGENVAVNTESHFDETFLPIIRKILNIFILAIALMVLLGMFGIEITPLIAGMGIAGLAIALALQDTLSNLFSGTYMISDKSIKPGDYIEIEGGLKGYVEEVGWRASKIRMLQNNLVIVPNAKMANSIVTNYNYPQTEMSVIVKCGVSYESDLEEVEKITIEVAKEIQNNVEGAIKDSEPFVRFNEFGDSNINFSVILRGNSFVAQYLMKHEFIKALKKRFDKEGIEISYPVRKVIEGK